MKTESRTISWFSCGAASAVATKLAMLDGPITIAYCEVIEEHLDNRRFLLECQEWFGQEIVILGNDEYQRSIYQVFEKTRFLCGPSGARCTGELKKKVRENYQRPGDIHIFGYTREEQGRLDRMIDANADLDFRAPLIERDLGKQDCLAIINGAGIEIPEMYKLGYKNNNCMGCVKASSPAYWRKIERDFPEMFRRMNDMEKHLGRSVCKIDMETVKGKYPKTYEAIGIPPVEKYNPKTGKMGKTYWRPKLDELPDDIIATDDSPDVQCGIFCQIVEDEIS